jgi:putative AbiEii toxin of type IV toxin-antitoxin system/AAA ATPase-like protein
MSDVPIQKIILGNYRSFRERHEIDLAPITVVLGKNNSGKSMLTRAPLIMATGFGTGSTSPLDLERLGPDVVDDVRELYFGHNTVRPMTLGLDVDGPRPFELRAELVYVDHLRSAVVAGLRLRTRQEAFTLTSPQFLGAAQPDVDDIDGITSDPMPELTPDSVIEYVVQREGELTSRTEPVPFRGLLPDWKDLAGLGPGPIRYLGPYRKRLGRQHRLPLGTPAELGIRGEGLPGLLAQDHTRGDGGLINRINDKLSTIVPGWQLREVPAGPLWSTVLTRVGSTVQVNLADAGSGLAQVLPILAQCAIDELRGDDGLAPLQIIEEPEMHLHPAAQAELADLYLATAQSTGTRFLVETHSETLLLRLRRRIAEPDNDYGPAMVAIYVVEQRDGESTIRHVSIDSLGNLEDSWPEGYFSQDYHEVRALAAAQVQRSEDAS